MIDLLEIQVVGFSFPGLSLALITYTIKIC